jgi:hypothetical protein
VADAVIRAGKGTVKARVLLTPWLAIWREPHMNPQKQQAKLEAPDFYAILWGYTLEICVEFGRNYTMGKASLI